MLASEIQLFPDKTFFFQLGIFLVVAVALNHFVFKPVLKIIQLRKAKTEGDRKKSEELRGRSEKLLKEYENKIKEAKAEGFQMKEAIRKEGEEQGSRIIQEARQATLVQTEQIKKEIGQASKTALKELEEKSRVLGKDLAEKILGRTIN